MTPDQRTALAGWLGDVLGLQGMPEVSQISGGQSNPTYVVAMDGRKMVLRKQPPGPLLKGAHAVDREYRVQSALRDTGVPVADMLAWCGKADVLGTPFYVMDWIDGRVFHETSLPGAPTEDRHAMYLSVARAMADMHAVDPKAVGLGDYGRPGSYFARQIRRWSGQLANTQMPEVPDLVQLQRWVEAHTPEDDGACTITHGDFRIGNIMFHRDRAEVAAVLDWELSTLGHPMADVTFFCLCWPSRQDEYGGLADLDWQAMGIPTKAEFLAEYNARSGGQHVLTPFHEAFAFFRFGVIFIGIAERAAQGNAAGDAGKDAMRLARAFGRHGMEVVAAA